MRFKLLIQVTLAAVIGVRATPVFDFPAVIHRSKIPAGITVHEYNATAAALGAAEAPKLEARNDWHQDSNCKGSGVCHHWVLGSDCISAANVRYGKKTQTQTYVPRENRFSQLRGGLCVLADFFR